MLGTQSWYIALAFPTVVVGGFVATRKRLAYQWREELMDPEGTAYPTVTDADMGYFRRVAPASAVEAAEEAVGVGSSPAQHAAAADGALGVQLTTQDNAGLNVRSDLLLPEMRNVLLNEVQRWAQTLGNPVDERKVSALEQHLAAAEEGDAAPSKSLGATAVSRAESSTSALSFDFLRRTRVIADHAEDIQPMKAPWGCGDRMRLEEMPASLRYLVHHVQQSFEGMGRVRHVYVEYSPTGKFYRAPRPPKMYDGHDYVVIPLRRDGADTVVTMSPVLRSRMSDLREVARHSWTTRDVDALLPAGCMLRVYGTARYEWGWGVRPGTVWFGSRLNRVSAPSRCADASAPGYQQQEKSWQRWLRPLNALWGQRTAAPPQATLLSAPAASALSDAALIVLHYEGPRANNKQRSVFLQPERWIFGQPPSVETYETWIEERPSADSAREEGVLKFIMRNYSDMLTVS